MSKTSVAIYGIRAKKYGRLLLKDDDGLWQNDIPFIFVGEYYSLAFNDKSYIISHHIKSSSLKGMVCDGYYVLSIAVPRGKYLMDWKSVFDELEHITKDALCNAENATEFKTLLLNSTILGQAMTRWSLLEDSKQFKINVLGKDRIRKGLIKYANVGDLDLYFKYPCRPAYIGYDTIYIAERDSKVAEKFVSMKLSEVHEPVAYEYRYSVVAEYYVGGEKIGEIIYPKEVISENEVVSFEIDEPNYEKVIIYGSLKDNWGTWHVRRNEAGTGFILAIYLEPKEVCIRLVCKELDEKGIADYRHYIRVTSGVLKGNVVIQRGKEIEKKVNIIPIGPYEVDMQYREKTTVEFFLRWLCRISVSGKYVERILKSNKLLVEYQIDGEKGVKFSKNSSCFSIAKPKEKTALCRIRLKGYFEQVIKIDKSQNNIKICLVPKQSLLLLYNLSDAVRRGGIPFVLGGVIIGGCVAWYMNKSISSVLYSAGYADSTEYVDSYLRYQANIPPEKASIVDASSDPVSEKMESVEIEDNTYLLDATKHITVLGGIEFTADDIKAAESYYKKNNKKIDAQTATLMRKKIRCAKEIIKACQKGFSCKSVSCILEMEAVNTVYTEVQKAALQELIKSGPKCSQVGRRSIKEKLDEILCL